jgi:hypothetical protein
LKLGDRHPIPETEKHTLRIDPDSHRDDLLTIEFLQRRMCSPTTIFNNQ